MSNGTWISATGGSWTNAANWQGGTIASYPGVATINAAITGTQTLIGDGAAYCTSIAFSDGGSFGDTWVLSGTLGVVGTRSATPSPATITCTTPTTISGTLYDSVSTAPYNDLYISKAGLADLTFTYFSAYNGSWQDIGIRVVEGAVVLAPANPLTDTVQLRQAQVSGSLVLRDMPNGFTPLDAYGTTLVLGMGGNGYGSYHGALWCDAACTMDTLFNAVILVNTSSYTIGSGSSHLFKLIVSTISRGASGTTTFNAEGSGGIYVSSVISGGAGTAVVKTGNYLLTMAGAHTTTGAFVLSAGTVNLGIAQNGTTSGPLGASGTITMAGGTLQYSSVNQTDYSPRFATTAAQAFNCDTNGQAVQWATSLVSTGGTLSKSGSGTLTITGANTYDGSTTVSGGSLVATSGALAGTSDVSVTGGAGLSAVDCKSGMPVTVDATSTATFSGAGITLGAVTTANTAAGSLRFTASTGTTTLASLAGLGRVEFSASAVITALNNSGTVVVQGSDLTVASGTSSGPLVLAGGLTKTTSGTLTLSYANTYAGVTNCTAGTLVAAVSESVPAACSVSGGTVVAGVVDGFASDVSVSGTGTLQTTTANAGKLTLVGKLTVNGGTLRFGG